MGSLHTPEGEDRGLSALASTWRRDGGADGEGREALGLRSEGAAGEANGSLAICAGAVWILVSTVDSDNDLGEAEALRGRLQDGGDEVCAHMRGNPEPAVDIVGNRGGGGGGGSPPPDDELQITKFRLKMLHGR